jgi:phosphatidate phosphatase PAH1
MNRQLLASPLVPALLALLLAVTPGCDDEAPAPPLGDASADAAEAGADAALFDGGADLGADGPVGDAALPCSKPVPFVAPGKPAGFLRTETKLLVITQGKANHRGQDVVVAAGAPQVLIGKFAYGPFDKDLEAEEVEVWVRPKPCGSWVSLGKLLTSKDGQHGTLYGIKDDGGRIFFKLPTPLLPVGRYPVRLLVLGDHSVAKLTLHVVKPDTGAVVFDIDGTLTTDDFQLVSQLFSQLFLGKYVPKMYTGAVDVVKAWTVKGYLPIYVTARPDLLNAISKDWLIPKGFPPGALHLTDTTTQSLPANTAKYKADFLNKLQAAGTELEIYAAYGNAGTDIEAYESAQIPKARSFIIGKNGGNKGTVALKDYPSHLAAAKAMPAAGVAAPAATFGW